MKKTLLALLLFVFVSSASAATLQGSCFEWFSLEKLNNVIIDVNSTPMQRIVAKQGDYSLQLQKGDYLLHAEYFENNELKYAASEIVSIKSEGTFNLDLIMFPPSETDLNEFLETGIDYNIEFPQETATGQGTQKTESFNLLNAFAIIVIMLVALLAVVFFLETRKKTQKETSGKEATEKKNENAKEEKEEAKRPRAEEEKLDKYAKEVLEALHSSGNRLTQKELREKVQSVGEAKISLIISELEQMGKVKKIKKGRGNIIVLKDQ